MFCNKCGTQLEDGSKYCYMCGNVLPEVNVQDNIPAEEAPAVNPYQASQEPVPAPYGQPYYPAEQPQVQQAAQPYAQPPQQPAQPYAQPSYEPQPYNNGQYNQPYVNQPAQNYQQAPYGSPYNIPQQMPSYQGYPVAEPAPASKASVVFPFISAGIMALISILFFLPWFTAGSEGYSMFSPLTNLIALEYLDMDGLILCTIIMIVDFGMLIPGFVLALTKRNNMPITFVVASSVLTFTIFTFFIIFASESYYVTTTAVPYLSFILTIGNIIFGILARKK